MIPSDSTGSPSVGEALHDHLVTQLTQVHELKRQVSDKERERQDQLRDFLLGLIDLLDALEQKDATLRERYAEAPDALKIVSSYGSVQKRLLRQLDRYGVARVDFTEGRLLVGVSKVVDREPDASRPNDSIVSIVRQGYVRGNTVLREAEVIVVKN